MKKVFFYLLLFLAPYISRGQSANDVGKIALALEMPKSIDKLNAAQLSKLETRINLLVTSGGLVANGSMASFTIVPSFIVMESTLVEGGMAKLTVVTTEFNLSIKQIDNKTLFATLNKQIKGSGNSETLAISNAISKIQYNDPTFKQFFETGKNKIIQYYESACDQIISKSESLLMLQKYEESLAVLMTVPPDVKCFNTIQDKAILAFGALQNQQCSNQLQKAKSFIAGEKFDQAIEILAQIDPAASCHPETQTLLNSIKNKSTKDLDLLNKKSDNPDTLKKIRMQAVQAIVYRYVSQRVNDNTIQTQMVQQKVLTPDADPMPPKSSSKADSSTTKTKRRYFALIMGVEKYDDPAITSLSEPIKDAGLLKQVLVDRYTFQEEDITFLKNPTFEGINVAFEELTTKIGPADFLLIFYAGHGYFDEKTNIGYWLPSDAEKKNRAKWFRNSALVENIRAIDSKHTLLIADACFSGGIFKTRAPFNNAAPDIAYMLKRASRKAMTSGSLTTVPDKSIFMKYLLKTLTENPNLYLPSEDLFDEVKTSMKSNADTKPLYGEIQNAGDEGGNFVLIRKN